MSQSEQEDSRPPSRGEVEVEEQEEKDTPLTALAPDASLPEELPSASTDVSASPAFQCLDEVRLINVVRWSYFVSMAFWRFHREDKHHIWQ